NGHPVEMRDIIPKPNPKPNNTNNRMYRTSLRHFFKTTPRLTERTISVKMPRGIVEPHEYEVIMVHKDLYKGIDLDPAKIARLCAFCSPAVNFISVCTPQETNNKGAPIIR